MKKIIATLVTILMMTCMLTGVVAQEEETNPGTTPDSVWYGFDRAMERVSLVLTFNKTKKAQKRLMYAEERMNELKEMTRQGKHKYMQELINNRDKNMNKADEIIEEEESKGKNMSQVRSRLQEQHQRHVQVFTKVLEQVGNEQARQRIQANMNKSEEKFQEKTQNKTSKNVIKAINSGNKNVTHIKASNDDQVSPTSNRVLTQQKGKEE